MKYYSAEIQHFRKKDIFKQDYILPLSSHQVKVKEKQQMILFHSELSLPRVFNWLVCWRQMANWSKEWEKFRPMCTKFRIRSESILLDFDWKYVDSRAHISSSVLSSLYNSLACWSLHPTPPPSTFTGAT